MSVAATLERWRPHCLFALWLLALWLLAVWLGLTAHSNAQDSGAFRFQAIGPESGISFEHTTGENGNHYVIEPYTAGLAIFDFDNDGLEDIYFVNGAVLPDAAQDTLPPPTRSAPRNRLYRNLGNWKFQDVTESAGVGDTGYGLGCVAGDIDSDGDQDLFVSNFGTNTYYLNNGDGTFSRSGLGELTTDDRFSAGVALLDIERDGDLDIFCGNYQEFQFKDHIVRMIGDAQFHPGPSDYPPARDQLFRNNADGTFTDISATSGISEIARTSMGVLAGDFDGDNDDDIIVANDSQPNTYWVNDGTGRFHDEAVLAGLAYDRSGDSNGNMGLESRDVDGDGLIDVVGTTYQDELPVFYRNEGGGLFSDETNRFHVDRRLYAHVNWGVGLEDFNNDGAVDLFIACGHFMDNVHVVRDSTKVKVADFLQAGQRGGLFRPADEDALPVQRIESARGAAFSDLDCDGDIDIVVMNANAPPIVLRNLWVEDRGDQNWLQIRLVGTKSNRDATGAIVRVTAGGLRQSAMSHSGRGYQSHYGQLLHFGIPANREESAAGISIEVLWPSGIVSEQTITPNPGSVGKKVTIIER